MNTFSCTSISDKFQAPSALPSKVPVDGKEAEIYLTCVDAAAAVLPDSEVTETVDLNSGKVKDTRNL